MTHISQRRLNGQAQTEARNAQLVKDKAALTSDLNSLRAGIKVVLGILPDIAANTQGRAILQAALNDRAAQQAPRKTRAAQ